MNSTSLQVNFEFLSWITLPLAREQKQEQPQPGLQEAHMELSIRKNDFVLQNFAEHLKDRDRKELGKTGYLPYEPFAIERRVAGGDGSKIFSLNGLTELFNSGSLESSSIIQKYILPPAGKASVTRVLYHNHSLKATQKTNCAFFIQNKDTINDYSKDFRTRACFCLDAEDSFDVYPIRGKPIALYEKLAQNVLLFMQRTFVIKITSIVLDFTKDTNGKIWLLDLHSYKVQRKAQLMLMPPVRKNTNSHTSVQIRKKIKRSAFHRKLTSRCYAYCAV